ncbi:hypothetical protein JVU11DRAFT_3300 [Chiua virens]|nr:hypothetical protein JVU11DRAFT_3300 [Chiua virens]
MPGINLAPLNTCRRASSCLRTGLMVTFLVLWILAESIRRDDTRQPPAHLEDELDFAASDFIKSLLSLAAWFISRHLKGVQSLYITSTSLPTVEWPLLPAEFDLIADKLSSRCPQSDMVIWPLGSVRLTLSILVVGLVYALRAYTDLQTRGSVDPFTFYLVFPVTILGILVILRITAWRTFPSAFWHASILQFAGFLITRNAFVGPILPRWDLLFSFAICNSIWISLVDMVYGLHRTSPVHLMNTAVFAQSCLIHSLAYLLQPSRRILHSYHNRFSAVLQVVPLLEAAKDVVAIFIIQEFGGFTLGILSSLASTLLITVDTWKSSEAPYPATLGCLIAILGFGAYLLCGEYTGEQQLDLFLSTCRCSAAAIASLVALGYVIVTFQSLGTNSSDLSSMWMPLSDISSIGTNCRVLESSTPIRAKTIANYAHFNNVLLIVFFSHARYDGNLDFHKEVYADYFPNIVYIGPATREDKGFSHSYDVLVDSFQSDEDLSDPDFYMMAGRMAHHMLYTALREYDCYDGYLWVPFDTLLNIPRLQQFNQSLFWYHSPWGHPVPNLALGNLTEPYLNISRHAPPAMISPDPFINLTQTWKGWGPDWCDPHVGVSVCMNAFHKVPVYMRARLAGRTNGQTRLIGGSADTLYIPGRHRKAFMDVLALFLETNCFLEIATPTTVHLVVPPGEPIQFVDHWWIYQPPFNASFVRQKWAQGYEVDTFHTFHWGERGEDGAWRGDHDHVADVRHLLRESAHRQGLNDTFPVNV